MLFSSLHFVVFFLVFFLCYWLVFNRKLTLQNIVLLAGSYLFYGLWDLRFLLLLAGFSLFNYVAGLLIGSSKSRTLAKTFLITGLIGNIGTLVLFKYFDFFLTGFQSLLSFVHLAPNIHSLKIIVPIGISFYTFLSISYIVDVYRKKLPAERNLPDLMITLSFFPIVLAGPIERPVSLLPQIKSRRMFDPVLATDGMRQFLWGLAVKLIIADNCAVYVDKAFANSSLEGSMLFYGAVFFAIQIYADFSSYSDMAIGIAKILGFRIVRNFNYPYFAKDIADFWKRWHMSLTSWFRDYMFLPLAYYLSGKIRSNKVLFIPTEHLIYSIAILFTWSLTGLWHGAAATFLVWGLIHAVLLIVHQVLRKVKKEVLGKYNLKTDVFYLAFQRMLTLLMVVVAWVFFRAGSLPKALDYLDRTLTMSLFAPPKNFPTVMILPIIGFFIIEWFQRNGQHGLDLTRFSKTRVIRWSIYLFLLSMTFFYQVNQQDFLYFKF